MNTSSDPPSTTDTATPEPPRSRVLALLAAGNGVGSGLNAAAAVFMAVLLKDFGVTYTAGGGLNSLRRVSHLIGFTVGGLATDLLKDRKGLLLLSLLCMSLLLTLQGFATTFWVFGALVCIQGLLGSLWNPPARAAIGDRFPDRMGLALAIHSLGGGVGAALTPIATAAGFTRVTWRTVYRFQFLAGAIATLFLWLLLPRLRGAAHEQRTSSYAGALRRDILANLPLIGLAVVAALQSIGTKLFSTFVYLFLWRGLDLGTDALIVYVACLALGQLVCLPIAGHVSDRWGRKSTIIVSLTTGGFLVGLMPSLPPGWLPVVAACLGGITLHAAWPAIHASVLEHAPRELWGASQAFVRLVVSAFVLLSPSITRAGAWLFGEGHDFPIDGHALYLPAGVHLVAAALILMVPEPENSRKT